MTKVTSRMDLNDPKLNEVSKHYLEVQAAQHAERIAATHKGQWAYLGLVGLNLQKLAIQMNTENE